MFPRVGAAIELGPYSRRSSDPNQPRTVMYVAGDVPEPNQRLLHPRLPSVLALDAGLEDRPDPQSPARAGGRATRSASGPVGQPSTILGNCQQLEPERR